MLSLYEFVEKAIDSGLENNSDNVWSSVEGLECTCNIQDVLGYGVKEVYPFEASERMEEIVNGSILDTYYNYSQAWDVMYKDYQEQLNNRMCE